MRRERAASQLLTRAGPAPALETVRALLAVQAQDARSARLALRARGVREIDEAGLCVTWLMRGTLHLVCVDDLPWLHALTAPTRMRAALRRVAELEVADPEAVAARAGALLREEGPLEREALGERLGLTGQALPNVLMLAALRGELVRSLDGTFRSANGLGRRGRPVDREAALRELGRRYLAAHAPAEPRDLARWAGLPLRDVRLPETGGGAVPAAVPARLLPPFDPYLLGWRDRGFAVPAALARRVTPGGGMLRAAATIDGLVVGTWGARSGRVHLDVPDPSPFAAEVEAVEAFLAR